MGELRTTERIHDAAVIQKSDQVFLPSAHQSVIAVWGLGGKGMLVYSVLHAVLGRLRHYQYFNQGDSNARAVTLILILSGCLIVFNQFKHVTIF